MTRVVVLVAILTTALSAVGASAYFYLYAGAYAEPPALTMNATAPKRSQSPSPPEFAPDFQFTDLDGKTHRLSDWTRGRGKYVLLNFWAPWCPPCREEIPMLLDLQKRYGDEGLQIIGPAVDQGDPVAEYVASMRIPYPVFYGYDRVVALSERYGDTMGALPYSVLIAPDGRILEYHAGRLTEAMARRWVSNFSASATEDHSSSVWSNR